MKVAIIGGGASGVLTALRLKNNNSDIDVKIFEKSNKLLKKLSMSGNGRCNLGNENIEPRFFYNQNIISKIIDSGYKDTSLNFLHELGLFTIADNAGRIYPKSNQAATVVELLNKELFYKRVVVNLNSRVNKIEILPNNKYKINDEVFDKVVISIGTNAQFEQTDYEILNDLNVKSKKFKPALVGFKVKDDIKDLFGVKALAKVSIGNHESKGEVVFKEDGISGICIMDLSVFYNGETELYLDFLEDYSYEQLQFIIDRKLKNDPYIHLHNLLFGSVNNKLLARFNKGFPNVRVSSLDKEVLKSYINNFKNFKLSIIDTYGIGNAQVANGGILLDEVNNFELINYPNVYVTGEVLDQVGICGGYNLWFAFTSGIMVADKICK